MTTTGRGAAREGAILLATLELLAEAGYDQLTMDAVAARARSSKATIYRRWPGKADLVIAAMQRRGGEPAPEAADTGSLRGDLLAAVTAMRDSLTGQDAALLIGLVLATQRDPALAELVRGQVVERKRAVFSAVIARAARRGDLPAAAGHQVAAEIASAMLLSRLLVTGEPIDDAFLAQLVDAALLPVLNIQPG